MTETKSDGSELQETLRSYESKERSIEDLASDERSDLAKQEEALANVAAEIQARDTMADDSGVEGSFVAVEEGGESIVRFIATDDRSLEEARAALASKDARVEFEEVEYGSRETVIDQFVDEYMPPTPHGLPGRDPDDPVTEVEQLIEQVSELTQEVQQEDNSND